MYASTILLAALATFASAATTNTELRTVFPASTGTTNLPAAKTVAARASFDGNMMKWDRSPSTCQQQTETGEKDAIFVLEDGATLSNVIIGPNNGEGVHCKGTCTLNNVWWVDICEDAATFKQKSGTSYVNGGGAQSGSDKIFQHNGAGTLNVKNFYAKSSGKLYRSCGNCGTQYARKSTFTNIYSDAIKVAVGINPNLGDTTVISNSCIKGGDICNLFEGNDSGAEPKKIASKPDGKACIANAVRTSGC